MHPSKLQTALDILKLQEGLREYFRLLAENARSHDDMPYAAPTMPFQTREAALS